MSPLSTLPKPRSRARPIMRNEEVFLVRSTNPAAALEYVNSQGGGRPIDTDFEKCLCGKCEEPIDSVDECRFYTHRGGRLDGLQKAAHARCVPMDIAVQLSLETAVQIFLRQSGQGPQRKGNSSHEARA